MKTNRILLRRIDESDKNAFSLWFRDIDVVKFIINMFKVSRESDNVLKIPFGKNRKAYILQTIFGSNIGFCCLYNIDWQQKKCSMYIYLDNKNKFSDDNMCDIINSIFRKTNFSKKFKIIEVHTKDKRFVKYIRNVIGLKKYDNEFVFEIGLNNRIS